MTSLAAAIASDSRGPCALYLITDSRITWARPTERWDVGRKTFVSPVSADVFGYCGDAYFMPMALGQVLNMVACGVVDLTMISSEERHTAVLELLKYSLGKISTKYASAVALFHGARESEFMSSKFRLWRSEFNPSLNSWSDSELPVDHRSYLASIDGSGASKVKKYEANMATTAAAGTSRAAIHAFCESLHSGDDPFSGGAPQLVGLWRKGPAKQFGFCWHGRSFIAGMEYLNNEGHEKVDWFNNLFERCDGRTGRRMRGSSSHRSSLKI